MEVGYAAVLLGTGLEEVRMTTSEKFAGCSVIIGLVAVIGIAVVGAFWKASIQAEVYRRQGVEMSVFEVMMGAKPIERVIHLK